MKNWNAPILYALIYQLLLAGCASHSRIWVLSLDECVDQLEKQIESRPAQTHLETLDGQKVNITEFYSENGEFMGLAVYLGNGLYYPLPYSKYSGAKEKLPYWMKKIHMPPQSSRLTGTSSLKRTESL
jgi:hypothetical protein